MRRYVITMTVALIMIVPLVISRLGYSQTQVQPTQTREKPKGDAVAGKELYLKNCKTCHGDMGQGNPRMYTHFKVAIASLGSSQTQQKSDEEIRKSMTDGFGKIGNEEGLSPGEIENILAFVRTLKEEKSKGGDVEAGKALYVKQCERCHGDKGQGVPRMYRVVSAAIVHLGSPQAQQKSDQEIRESMTLGCCKPTNKMLAMKELDAGQIENVLAYIRTLKQ